MLSAVILLLQVAQVPQRTVTDPGVIATNQRITPAGVQSVFDGQVTGLKFGRDARELWVAVPGTTYQLAWSDNRVLRKQAFSGRAGIYGLVIDPVTERALVSTVGRVPAGAARPPGVTPTTGDLTQLTSVMSAAAFAASSASPKHAAKSQPAWFGVLGRDMAGGPAVAERANTSGHRVVVLPLPAQNQLAVLDADNGRSISAVALGVVPIGAVVSGDGSVAWVTEMAGTKPGVGDRTAKQCCKTYAEQIRVDARGIALPGSVARVDLVRGIVTQRITVGRHPTGLTWDEKRGRLYVADGNDDRVTVIDTRTSTVLTIIDIEPFAERAIGLAPTAVALTPDANHLFVALGGMNAVAVYDVRSTARATLDGMLPTGWYPTTLDISSDGRFLAVGTLLGVGSGTGTTGGQTGRDVNAVRGSVNVIEIPNAARLAAYSVAVAENNRLRLAGPGGNAASNTASRADARPRAVPERPGEPSLIQHVVYIIRENRTYDQVLGDLKRGDGDPSLVMYGRDVTPNTHALAETFVTLDRMFASGGNSADGHQWLTQANETEYVLWPLYTGRSYPYDGSDALAYSSGGFIWDAAASRNRSVAVFGEFAPEKPDSGSEWRTRLLDDYRARRTGTGSAPIPTFNTTSEIPSLDRVLVRNFPTWTLAVPDVVRAEIISKNLKTWEAQGSMPNLVIIQLPSDHTTGTSATWSTPKASVADNDLALGQLVDAISHSSFWSSTAILVVEDDAQAGVDHVDGHRTVALAVSPYTRRGAVDSTFYNAPSLLKTIELMLGLPSLSIFDLVASDLGSAFIGPDERPDLSPFTAIEPSQSIYEVNQRPSQIRGAQREGALASARMRFDIPDAAPSDRLNRILWFDAKGWNTTYPGVKRGLFMPLSVEVADEEREEARVGGAKRKVGGKRKP